VTRRRSDLRQLESEKQHAGAIELGRPDPLDLQLTREASNEGSTWELGEESVVETVLPAEYP
jgi:hypothetical protein